MVDVNETQENPVIESETQAASEGEEIYEYEYVELEEGQELPEGYEYEYVEVDENGNPIENDEGSVSADADGQFLQAENDELSLDALLEGEAGDEETAVGEVPAVETAEPAAVPVNLDDLQLEDIQIPEEIIEPETSVPALANNVNDQSVFAEPEGIVFQNDDDDAAGKAWLEENNSQPVVEETTEAVLAAEEIIPAEEEDVTVVEADVAEEEKLIQAENPLPAEEEVIDDEALLSPEEGETSLDQLLDGNQEEIPVAVEPEEIVEAAGSVVEAVSDDDGGVLPEEGSQEVDEVLIETLGDAVVPSADEIAGGIPPIENSVMEEMIADGKTVSVEELPDEPAAEAVGEAVVEEPQPEPSVSEEMLAGVLDAVSESAAEEEIAVPEVLPEPAEEEVADIVSEQDEETAEAPVEEIAEEIPAVEEPEDIVGQDIPEQVAVVEEEPVLTETNVTEDVAAFIPQTNVDDNIFVDEELELPPELSLPEISAAAAGAEMLLVGNREIEQLSINSDEVRPEIETAEFPVLEELAAKAYPVGKNDGVRSLTMDEDGNILLLNDLDFENNELRFWNMVLFNQHILPLKAPVNNVSLPLEHGVNRRITLIRNGVQKIKLFNEDNIKIINATNACAKVEGRFICGDLGDNSGLVVDDCLTIPLADMYGKVISFASPVSGFLSGPNGALIYFSELAKLVIPNNEKIKADVEKLQYRISKWYSGTANDKYFEFSANSDSAVFEGNNDIKAIHVNVNNSSYGWNVTFDNGLSMNLRDLREYQTKYGRMPSPNGVISYGKKTLSFSKVERIVVYESVQYFFYS